ncbi:MAG: ATP-binding protein [Nitrospira sp.]|nr:ATP-binding protein [Nitrospira sp.]
MSTDRPTGYLVSLVRELCKLPQETEWLEFKVNDAQPQEIGELLSALSNSSALAGKAFAYLVWGIADGDHAIVGTQFSPRVAKVGNEELENWLLKLLTPKIHFRFLR